MSHHDDEKDLAGTAKFLRAMKQYRNLDSNSKEILDLEKQQGSEFIKAVDKDAGRIDSFSKYQVADEDTRTISRENGMVKEVGDDWSATTHSDAVEFSMSDQIALEGQAQKKPDTKK